MKHSTDVFAGSSSVSRAEALFSGYFSARVVL
jgi:hypothetical protein